MRGRSFAVLMVMVLILGCSRSNIKIPEVDVAPVEARKGDSHISIGNLRNYGSLEMISQKEETVTLRVAFVTRENDVAEVNVFYEDGTLKKKRLKSAGTFHGEEYYFGDIEITGDEVQYFFEVKDGKVRYFSGKNGGYYLEDIEKHVYKAGDVSLSEPVQWNRGVLWYGIYVDSFYNGDRDNDPIFNEFGPEYFLPPRGVLSDGTFKSDLIDAKRWNSEESLGEFTLSEWDGDFFSNEAYEKNIEAKYNGSYRKNTRRYGGDLQGIIDKLDYLSELGVGGINLSNVFYSYSSDKDDIIDYRHISPDFGRVKTRGTSEYKLLDMDPSRNTNNFGEGLSEENWKMTESDELLKELVEKAHARGMKIILDVNLDYVSKNFWGLKMSDLQGGDSSYKNWFFISGNEPGDRVRVNYDNPEYRKYLVKSLEKWVSVGVDGYRIQGENLPGEFLSEIKRRLKDINPEFILVKSWGKNENIGERNYDNFENYSFGALLTDYISDWSEVDGKDIEGAVSVYNNLNNDSEASGNFVYLDSKETDRVFSMLVNPGRSYDTLNSSEDGYLNVRPDLLDADSVEKLKNLVMIQMTITGSPYIYYGSEKGMWGGDVPYNRKPMGWESNLERKERDIYENYERKNKLNISQVKYNKIRNYIEYPYIDNQKIYDTYSKLIKFRNQRGELFSSGEIRFLKVYNEETGEEVSDVLAYERFLENDRVIVVVNRSKNRKKVAVSTESRGLLKSLWKEESKRIAGRSIKIWLNSLEGEIYYK